MNTPFRADSLQSLIPHPSSTVSGYNNVCHGYGQGSIPREISQRLLLYHMNPDQGDQPAQEPLGRHLASTVPSRSPTPSQNFYHSIKQLPVSADHQHREASNIQSQKIWLFTDWAMEILSCAIASLCLAAIFGILYTHQGLPLPQWPLHITINALIAVFTAIFKMALIVPVADGEYPQAQDQLDDPHSYLHIDSQHNKG